MKSIFVEMAYKFSGIESCKHFEAEAIALDFWITVVEGLIASNEFDYFVVYILDDENYLRYTSTICGSYSFTFDARSDN